MRESILTIPISELFAESDGCPVCRMREMLEQRAVDYILGAAMMEPSVRLETNRLGFCKHHLERMQKKGNRLSLALMLQSHLEQLNKELFKRSPLLGDKKRKKARLSAMQESCYLCDKIDWGMERLLATVFEQYAAGALRDTFRAQEMLCLPHYDLLLNLAPTHLRTAAVQKAFADDCAALAQGQLELLYADVSHFCKMYDYRNTGADADWGNARDAIERAAVFLTGRD